MIPDPSRVRLLRDNRKTWLSLAGLSVIFIFGMFCVVFLQ
jgi:hypothetical protein